MTAPATTTPIHWTWLRRTGPWPAVLLFVLVAVGHYLGLVLAYTVNRVTSEGVPLFPAAGLTVALLLLVPRRSWVIVLTATFVGELVGDLWLIGQVAGTAIGSSLSNVLEPLLGAVVVLRLVGGPPSLSRRRHLVDFVIGAVVAGPILGAIVGTASTQLTPGHQPFFSVVGRWFTGDALGVLVVGSLILAWAVEAPSTMRARNPRLEALMVAISIVALTVIPFWWSSPVLAYLALPPLGWAALRFGVRGATLGGATIALLADWATLQGHGLFAVLAGSRHDEALWQLQLFLGVLLLTALVVASQVTELGEAERALRASEEAQKLSSLLESSPDPVWILQPDGTVEYVNKQLEVLTGRDRGELIGRPFGGLLTEAGSDGALAKLQSIAYAPAGTRWEFEMTGLGEVLDRSLEVAVSPLDTVDGRLLVATIRDVTERNAADLALRIALDTAEQATKAKTEFLATMSHEIRTPMNGVIGMVDVLRRGRMDPSQAQMVETIGDSANALLSIIDDILDFSKIEAGKLTLEAAPLSLREVVDSIGELLASAAAAKNLELVCIVDDTVPDLVVGDALRIRQVLFNLLGNAIKFTHDGSVRVRVCPDDGGVSFTITDTGIGITDDQRRNLFQPFVQAEQSTTRRFGGSGLGLSIVARLVELMGSTVTVTSAPGAGSTFGFVVELPATDGPESTPLLAGLRVLAVVADGSADRTAVDALARAGAAVETIRPDHVADTTDPVFDVLYITRSAIAGDPRLLMERLAADRHPGVVADRSVDGRVLLAWAQAVETTAITGRSVVRAVAAAAGRSAPKAPSPQPVGLSDGSMTLGHLILVAEDNATNQVVIRHQLRTLGLHCEIANDGVEALDLVGTGRFALLLADIHMPRLDGYELTRMIRESEAGTDRHLPVIALTASALPSDRARCLEVGMDQVLTKPIEVDRLWHTLQEVLPDLESDDEEPPTPSAPPPAATTAPTVDFSSLREILGDDTDELTHVMQLFEELAADSLAELEASAAAADSASVALAAHKLRGAALSIGADPLAQLCLDLETGSASDVSAVHDELAAVLAIVADTTWTTHDG